MNCDRVFDILTRGPFPSGHASDEAVERHLTICHPCRQLAEALRPAVDLFHESVEAEEGRDLPGYHGVLCAPAVEHLPTVIQRALRRPDASESKLTRRWNDWRQSSAIAWRFAAAAVMGSALCVALWSMVATERQAPFSAGSPENPAASSGLLAGFHPDAEGQLMLASLQLRNVCRAGDAQPSQSGAVENDSQHCCTECHYASQVDRPPLDAVSLATINGSCHACHQPR